MDLARAILKRRFEFDHKDYNALIALARARGIPHVHTYFGPDASTARSVLDEVADTNLRAAPARAIERRISTLRCAVDRSLGHSIGTFDPARLGGAGAAGRVRDRARASERRNIICGQADRLQKELDRRALQLASDDARACRQRRHRP